MRNNKQILMLCVGLAVILLGYSAGHAKSNLTITYPANEASLSGYMIPVSWKDVSVERVKTTYPANYNSSKKSYSISISDLDNNLLLEKTVSGQNYYVFTHQELANVLEQKVYVISVRDVSDSASTVSVRVSYLKPFCDVPSDVLNSAPADTGSTTADPSSQSTLGTESLAMSATAYTACSYCRTYSWPGMLVIYVNATTYNKQIVIYCNQTTWYSTTVQASYSGPVFVNISSGNYDVNYNDGILATNKCVTVNPFAYTVITFP